MTYNVLAWNSDHVDMARVIRAIEPDLVSLQEVSPVAARALHRELGGEFPYSAFHASPDPSGAGVLSRFPLREVVGLQFSGGSHWSQRMEVETPDGPITYFNIHTSIPRPRARWLGPLPLPAGMSSSRRRGEIEALTSLVDGVPGPLLLTGDFNLTERSLDYRLLRSRLGDGFRAAGTGLGLTFPNFGHSPRLLPIPWPTLRIDYVWFSAHFEPVRAYVAPGGKSDHLPVIAEFVRAG